MFDAAWPLFLIVASNVIYHILSKNTPGQVNPFASLVLTYLIAAAASFALFCFTADIRTFPGNIKQLNFTSYALGIAIIGLEAGYIYLYRAGWNISVGSLLANIALALCLLVVGFLFYQEVISIKQIVGAALCLGGLILINAK